MREYLMLWKWRFEQFQSVLGPAFYITTLTFLVYPYISWRVPEWGVKFAFGIIFGLLALAIMACAWIWDRVQMWRYAQRVNISRNQFQQGHLTPKERLLIERIHRPIMEALKLDTATLDAWLDVPIGVGMPGKLPAEGGDEAG